MIGSNRSFSILILISCVLYVVLYHFLDVYKFFHKSYTYTSSLFFEWAFSYHQTTKNPLSLEVARQYTISLTSSPLRIHKDISKTFLSFRDSQIKRILLHLPKLFRNDPTMIQNLDDLVKLKKAVPKLEVIWHETDTGPDLKFTGNFKPGVVSDDEQIVVIDDDTLYHNTMIDHIDQTFRTIPLEDHSKYIVAGQPQNRFGISIAPGCHSFAVKFGGFDSKLFLERLALYRNSSTWCKRHDDWTMGASFQDLGFTIVQMIDYRNILQRFDGFGDDALHMEVNAPIKNQECAMAIWDSRQMCPLGEPSKFAKHVSTLFKWLLSEN